MRTRHHTLTAVAGALLAAGLLAACGGSGDDESGDDVASLATDDPTTETTVAGSTPSKDPEEAMLEFTECMRDHGIDMPDPTFSDNGGVEVQVGSEGSQIDEEAMEAANEACAEDGMFMAAPAQVGDGD